MLPYIPWAVEEPETVEVKREKIKEWDKEFQDAEKFTYGVFDLTTGHLAGMIQLFTRQGPDILEIGYITGQDFAGRGLATAASYAMTKLGFEHIGIGKMVIHCDVKNIPSKRVPQKLNYELEEIRKEDGTNGESQQMIWAMNKSEFKLMNQYEPIIF